MRCLIVAGALQPLGAVHRTTVTRIEGQPRCDQAAHLLGRWAAAHQQAVSPAPRRWYELSLVFRVPGPPPGAISSGCRLWHGPPRIDVRACASIREKKFISRS